MNGNVYCGECSNKFPRKYKGFHQKLWGRLRHELRKTEAYQQALWQDIEAIESLHPHGFQDIVIDSLHEIEQANHF